MTGLPHLLREGQRLDVPYDIKHVTFSVVIQQKVMGFELGTTPFLGPSLLATNHYATGTQYVLLHCSELIRGGGSTYCSSSLYSTGIIFIVLGKILTNISLLYL